MEKAKQSELEKALEKANQSARHINELTAWMCSLNAPQMAFFLGTLSGQLRKNPEQNFWDAVSEIKASIGQGLKELERTARRD